MTLDTRGHPVLDRSVQIRQAADRLGFCCLDDHWQGWQAAYRFRCKNGHIVSYYPRGLIKLLVCKQCRLEQTWERLQASSEQAGVQCLDARWLGGSTYHHFQCSHRHTWLRTGRYALRDASCPRCSRAKVAARKRHSDGLERLQSAAARKGGDCLNTEYLGVDHYHRFRCQLGHEWEALGSKVLLGGWCPVCVHKTKSDRYLKADGLAVLQNLAANRGGTLLEHIYRGLSARYRLRCKNGHEWQTTGNILQSGGWCRRCYSAEVHRQCLEKAHQIALDRGGQCLTTEYPGSRGKWHWCCHRGHSWKAVLGSVKKGVWCPDCAVIARISKPGSKAWIKYSLPLSS